MPRFVEANYVKNTKQKYGQENHARQQLNQNNGSNNTTISKSSSVSLKCIQRISTQKIFLSQLSESINTHSKQNAQLRRADV